MKTLPDKDGLVAHLEPQVPALITATGLVQVEI